MYHNRSPNDEASEHNFEFVDLDTLLSQSDFIICTCAATKQTEKILSGIHQIGQELAGINLLHASFK